MALPLILEVEEEAGRTLQVQDHPGLQNEFQVTEHHSETLAPKR